MSTWPPGITIRPITAWPGQLTRGRRRAPFFAKWHTTLADLKRELRQLQARNTVLQVAMADRDFRVDGYPRADRRPEHPGVILSFDSKHGPLSYPCDTYTDWTDNLRAIALAMEALRAVDRYGVTRRGEQYAGWKALPPGAGSTSSSGFATADEALRWMRAFDQTVPDAETLLPRDLYRRLAKRLHPDAGGDRTTWDQLDEARGLLAKGGLL